MDPWESYPWEEGPGSLLCCFTCPSCPFVCLSGCQITKLKQQLQRTKLSRSGKEKERSFPLQGDHTVRGALRVSFVSPCPAPCLPVSFMELS